MPLMTGVPGMGVEDGVPLGVWVGVLVAVRDELTVGVGVGVGTGVGLLVGVGVAALTCNEPNNPLVCPVMPALKNRVLTGLPKDPSPKTRSQSPSITSVLPL